VSENKTKNERFGLIISRLFSYANEYVTRALTYTSFSIRGGHEPLFADTIIRAVRVHAIAVLTNRRIPFFAFVFVVADVRHVVVYTTFRAHALEGPHCVNTRSAFTHSRNRFALVDVCNGMREITGLDGSPAITVLFCRNRRGAPRNYSNLPNARTAKRFVIPRGRKKSKTVGIRSKNPLSEDFVYFTYSSH